MKKNYIQILFAILFLIGLQFNTAFAGDKIKIRLHQPPPNRLGVSDLWKLDITNTTNDNITIYLEGTAAEEKEGLIVSGKSKTFSVKPGNTTYGYNDFKNGIVTWKNNKYQEAIVRTGNAPTGNYTFCATAFFEDGSIADQETCIEQKIEIKSETQITLVSPNNGDEINLDDGLLFTWIAPSPVPKGGYTLRIIEIRGEQSPDVAMQNNTVFFEQKDIRGTSLQYPPTAPKFELGRRYAWMVRSGNNNSDPVSFGIIVHDLDSLLWGHKTYWSVHGHKHFWSRGDILIANNEQEEASFRIKIGSREKGCNGGWGICSIRYNTSGKLESREVIATMDYADKMLNIQFGSKLPEDGDIFSLMNDIMLDEETCRELGVEFFAIRKGEYKIDFSNNEFGTVSLAATNEEMQTEASDDIKNNSDFSKTRKAKHFHWYSGHVDDCPKWK